MKFTMNTSLRVCAILVVANFVNFLTVDAKFPAIKSPIKSLTKQTSQDEDRNLIADQYNTVLCEVDSRGHDAFHAVFGKDKALAIIDDAETFFLGNPGANHPDFDGSDPSLTHVGILSVFKKGVTKYEIAEQVVATGEKTFHFERLFYAQTASVLFAMSAGGGNDLKFSILKKNGSDSWAIFHDESLTECPSFAFSSNGRYAVCRIVIPGTRGQMKIYYAENSDLTSWISYEVQGESDGSKLSSSLYSFFKSFAFSDDGTKLVTSMYDWTTKGTGIMWSYSVDGSVQACNLLDQVIGDRLDFLGYDVRMSGNGDKVCGSVYRNQNKRGGFKCYTMNQSGLFATHGNTYDNEKNEKFLLRWALTPDGSKVIVSTGGSDSFYYQLAESAKKYLNGNGRIEVFELDGSDWKVTQTLLYPGGYVDQLAVTDKVVAYTSRNCWGGMVRVYSSDITGQACGLTSACSNYPSIEPSQLPSKNPSNKPSEHPSNKPSEHPSNKPSEHPSLMPTNKPSEHPSLMPTNKPSEHPSLTPSTVPSLIPTSKPSELPSLTPSTVPSLIPTSKPSGLPSLTPSTVPSLIPTSKPAELPSLTPSTVPSLMPSSKPSTVPSMAPSMTFSPSLTPSCCYSGIFSFLGLFGM